MIIDTHVHLDSNSFTNLDEIYQNAYLQDVKAFIIPAADPNDLEKAKEISQDYPNTFFASGVHPYCIDDFDLDQIKQYAKNPKCVAIGECGLDYFRGDENKKKQLDVFNAQIELSKILDLPLIIHSRDANQDTYNALKNSGTKGVLHCFNASDLLLDLDNFYFGIGGVLTFKNAKNLQDVLKKIPLEKILIETDAPYLSPEPFRGKTNEPARCKIVAQKIAQILNEPLEKIEQISTQNAINCFSLRLEEF